MRVTNLTLAAFVPVVVVVTVLVGGCASSGEVEVVADEAVLHQTLQRLEGVRDELDQLPNPLGATADMAVVDGCSTDSGAIFQPSVEKKWLVDGDAMREAWLAGTAGAMTGARLVKALRVAGWTVAGPDRRAIGGVGDTESYELLMQRDGWTAVGGVTAYDDEVSVYVLVKDAEPCHER
jgi:hypothetical protein